MVSSEIICDTDCQPPVNSRRRKRRKQQPAPHSSSQHHTAGARSKELTAGKEIEGLEKGQEYRGLLEGVTAEPMSRGCGHSKAETLQVELVRRHLLCRDLGSSSHASSGEHILKRSHSTGGSRCRIVFRYLCP